MRRQFLSKFSFSAAVVFHLALLLPLILILGDIVLGNLSADPVKEIIARTGKDAMIILLISLAATPVFIVTGFKPARKARKALGLYAFLYTAIHVAVYAGADFGWDWQLIWLDILDRNAAKAGLAAFAILLALAVTSTKGWQRRLKKNWVRLHKLVYASGVLVMLHYIWVQKVDIREPLLWTALLFLLLSVRIPPIRRWFTSRRGRRVAVRTSDKRRAMGPERVRVKSVS